MIEELEIFSDGLSSSVSMQVEDARTVLDVYPCFSLESTVGSNHLFSRMFIPATKPPVKILLRIAPLRGTLPIDRCSPFKAQFYREASTCRSCDCIAAAANRLLARRRRSVDPCTLSASFFRR